MSRTQQNLPRTLKAGARPTPAARPAAKRPRGLATVAVVAVLVAGIVAAILLRSQESHGVPESKIDHDVSSLLAGIPQSQRRLGSPTAPVTLQVFLDLKDPDSRSWFLKDLPAIIRQFVRPGKLELEYRAYKTNTRDPGEFVNGQTAALAAGNQDKLWNYIYTFYAEQQNEFAHYATQPYLNHIAQQIPRLDLTQWHADRHDGRREEQTTAEDQTARTLRLHVTPSFRIGKTHGPLHNYSGHAILKYGEQHPIALPDTADITKAITELN